MSFSPFIFFLQSFLLPYWEGPLPVSCVDTGFLFFLINVETNFEFFRLYVA